MLLCYANLWFHNCIIWEAFNIVSQERTCLHYPDYYTCVHHPLAQIQLHIHKYHRYKQFPKNQCGYYLYNCVCGVWDAQSTAIIIIINIHWWSHKQMHSFSSLTLPVLYSKCYTSRISHLVQCVQSLLRVNIIYLVSMTL